MTQYKILDPLLRKRFTTLNYFATGWDELGEIVKRYCMLKNDIPAEKFPDKLLGCNDDTAVINVGVTASEVGERLNTAKAPVEQFLRQKKKDNTIKVYRDGEDINIYYASTFDNEFISTILSCTAVLVPRLFPNGVDELDRAFIDALAKYDIDVIKKVTNKLVDEKLGDYRTEALKAELRNFRGRTQETMIKRLDNEIDVDNKDIKDLLDRINELAASLREKEIQRNSLIVNPPSENDELAKFFAMHKQLKIETIDSSRIWFTIVDTLKFYDKKELARELDNPSTLWGRLTTKRKEYIRKLLVEEKGHIVMAAKCTLNNDMIAEAYSHYLDRNKIDEYPHPHINEYSCLGSFRSELAKYNAKGEYDMAIETLISAVKNINVNDTTVMSTFINGLFNNRKPFIEMTGTKERVTLEEFGKRCGIETEEI